MEEIIYPINLDLRTNTHKVLVMKEDDVNSRVIEAVITDNGKPYDLTNCAVNLKWKKPDGHIVYADTERVDDSTVKVICTDQMLAVAGTAEAEFDITSTTAVASTLKFMVSINETVISNSDIESSDEFGALQDIMGHISNESIHVPSGGTSGQVLTMGNDGKSIWSDASSGSTSGDYLEKENPSGTGSFSMNRKADTTVGYYSVAEGSGTTASAYASHAEGYNTTASKSSSHAEGNDTTASGDGSHAEGCGTESSNVCSHAEGFDTTASGEGSHAEGYGSHIIYNGGWIHKKITNAKGTGSHAEGICTVAGGHASHSEGRETIASGIDQHVQGKYNVEDTNNEFAHIVGGGTSDTNRKNIHTIDWNGNAVFAGDVTYNGSQSLAEMIQNLCYCIGTFKDAEIVSRSHDELGEVKMACIPYSECSVLTTSNKIAVKFTNGSVGVFNVYSTEVINLNITWLTGTMPYVSSDVIQSGTNTLAINNYGNGYTTYDDTIFNEDGSVKQRMILEISSSDAELITSYRII